MPTGSSIAYVSGTTHVPIPLAADLLYRNAHAPQVAKPTGLDWAALAPTCGGCGRKSSEVAAGLCPGCRTSAPVVVAPVRRARPTAKVKPERPKPAARSRVVPKSPGGPTGPRPTTNTAAIVESYLAGNPMIEVARLTGYARATVRRVLDGAGVPIRDERGGPKVTRTPEFLAEVRRLYVEEHASLANLAGRMHISQQTAKALLEQQGVVMRAAAASPKKTGPAAQTSLRARLDALGVTAAEVKEWAVREGHLLELQPGIPPARVVDAFEAARKGPIHA